MTPYFELRIENKPVRRRREQMGMPQCLVAVIAGMAILAGFIWVISLRAETVQYDYQTQRLMRLREQLEREKHRLELQRAHLRSPQVIEAQARRLGLVRRDSSQVILSYNNIEFRPKPPISSLRGGEDPGDRAGIVAPGPWQQDGDDDSYLIDNGPVTGSPIRTRPKRVDVVRASEPTRHVNANADPGKRMEEPPRGTQRGGLREDWAQADLEADRIGRR